MSVRSFFDTNVLVYADDKPVPAKQKRAIDLVAEYRRARRGVASLAEFDVVAPEVPDILATIDPHSLHGFSFWDAMVLGQTGWMRGTFLRRYASSPEDRWG